MSTEAFQPATEFSADAWRGQCLNVFARAERAVGQAIEAAHSASATDKLRHLAGQRLADLIAIVEAKGGTGKELKAFANALAAWQSVEPKRQFLAHGVASESTDQRGNWVLLLDLVIYRKNVPSAERWAVKQAEAAKFLEDLTRAFKSLSGQLGHFRKRIST